MKSFFSRLTVSGRIVLIIAVVIIIGMFLYSDNGAELVKTILNQGGK